MNKADNFRTNTGETITISRAEYEKLQAQNERLLKLERQVNVLMKVLRLARHKRLGSSSEKSEEILVEQLSLLFNEAEVYEAHAKTKEEAVAVVVHKRCKKHGYTLDIIPEGIPTKQVEHRLVGEELACLECCNTMTEIGKEVDRTLEIIPAQTIVREDIYYTYACQNCNDKNLETPVVKAPKEKNIIPGSIASPEAIAHIMTQKFVMASLLYRQAQELDRQEIHLSRQTMSNWILRETENYLTPVYQQLHKELLARDVLYADKTTLQVLHEPGKESQSESYMWLYRTSRDTGQPIVQYEYQLRRAQNIRKSSWMDLRAIYIWTVTPDTTTFRKELQWLGVGRMPNESLAKQ